MTTQLVKSITLSSNYMIKGKVFTGEGKASEFLSMEPYTEFIEEKTGFEPYPGTLNIRSTEEEAQKIKESSKSYRMEPTEYKGKELGGLKLYIVEMNGQKCCIVEPDLTRYGEDVLEIVASFNLRERFNLEDGDTVEIKPVE